MKLKATDKITIFGSSGCGKTRLALKLNKMWPRTIIIDPLFEYQDDSAGKDTFQDFNLFSDKLIELKNAKIKQFKIIFRPPPDMDDENQEIILNQVFKLCFNFGNIQVLIDEVHLFTTPYKIPKYLKNIQLMGRHQAVSSLCISQRPGLTNKTILSQSKHVFVGQLHDKNDLNYISSFMNIPLEKIINLKIGEFIYFSPGQKIQLINN